MRGAVRRLTMLASENLRTAGSPNRPDAESDPELLFARVESSETLRSTPTLRTLLRYLWEHRDATISEYAIAVEALGRRSDFNPKIDASARVQMGRLRIKLKEFYSGEGSTFPLRLSIPLGGHELQHELVMPPPPATATASPRRLVLILACVAGALLVACGLLLFQNRKLQSIRLSSPAPASLPRFWQSFLAEGRPTSVVVPNPPYLYWRNQEMLVRDQKIFQFSDWTKSQKLRRLADEWGPPSVNENWMTAVDVLAAVQIIQYLEAQGRPAELIGTSSIPMDFTTGHNTIFVGGPRPNEYMQAFLSKLNFQVAAPYPIVIANRNPRPGEPSEYKELVQSDERRTCPGLIVLMPPTSQGTRSLLVIGRVSTAIVSMLLSNEGLSLLDKQWRDAGSPKAWEMVVQTEIRGETVLKVAPLALRPIADSSS